MTTMRKMRVQAAECPLSPDTWRGDIFSLLLVRSLDSTFLFVTEFDSVSVRGFPGMFLGVMLWFDSLCWLFLFVANPYRFVGPNALTKDICVSGMMASTTLLTSNTFWNEWFCPWPSTLPFFARVLPMFFRMPSFASGASGHFWWYSTFVGHVR